jgi:hypothetical protein
MFCTVDDIRKLTKKLNDVEVADEEIEQYIAVAEKVVMVDLSPIIDADKLQQVTNGLALSLLTSYKTCELMLSAYYGASRKIDEVTDIQFFQKLYNKLLQNIVNGNVKLDGANIMTKSYPALEKKRTKLYNVKGEQTFFGDDNKSANDVEYDE